MSKSYHIFLISVKFSGVLPYRPQRQNSKFLGQLRGQFSTLRLLYFFLVFRTENMKIVCENKKTLQSTLVQKGEGGDVDWPFWVQQVQQFEKSEKF